MYIAIDLALSEQSPRGIKAVKIAPLPLIATVFPGLPPEIDLAASATLGILEYYLESNRRRKSDKKWLVLSIRDKKEILTLPVEGFLSN